MNGGADASSRDHFTNLDSHIQTREFATRTDFLSGNTVCIEMENKVTDFSGKWKMKSSENFEELLKALGEIIDLGLFIVGALLD